MTAEIGGAIDLSLHAKQQLDERNIELAWVAATLRDPEFTRCDKFDPSVKLSFRRVPEMGDRWLRVVYAERLGRIFVISVFFDRKAEKWR